MATLGPWLGEAAAAAPYSYVALATILWFSAIYLIIAGGACWLVIDRLPEAVTAGGRTQRLRPGQVKEELFLSVLSILVFAAQATALVSHAFSPLALIGLTIMSLLLNVSGHLPHEQIRRAFAFVAPHSRYHNRHHRDFRTHYGFSFPLLDRWFGGTGSSPAAGPGH
jgi:sterol desaturase/sphingolipid hydroxylase (fatty acid hydroxylase superfamily)